MWRGYSGIVRRNRLMIREGVDITWANEEGVDRVGSDG